MKARPSTSVTYNQRLNPLTEKLAPAASDLRENSNVTLLAIRTAVFNQRTRGSAVRTQSFEIPFRTTRALVKAAKSITMAASAIHMPVRQTRRLPAQPWESGPPPPPPNPAPPPK